LRDHQVCDRLKEEHHQLKTDLKRIKKKDEKNSKKQKAATKTTAKQQHHNDNDIPVLIFSVSLF